VVPLDKVPWLARAVQPVAEAAAEAAPRRQRAALAVRLPPVLAVSCPRVAAHR
jgi:hypothetical protein